jgi:hypothetical protein
MKSHVLLKSSIVVIALVCLFPQPAMAYVGPGAGLSAIGVFLAILAGIIVAIFGFLWYPFKRLIRMLKKRSNNEKGGKAE